MDKNNTTHATVGDGDGIGEGEERTTTIRFTAYFFTHYLLPSRVIMNCISLDSAELKYGHWTWCDMPTRNLILSYKERSIFLLSNFDTNRQ